MIQYAIDQETGLTWSRIGHKIAVPVIDHKDPFYPRYSVYKLMIMEEHDLNYLRPNNTTRQTLRWGAELPPSIKKYHDKFWKSKLLVVKSSDKRRTA